MQVITQKCYLFTKRLDAIPVLWPLSPNGMRTFWYHCRQVHDPHQDILDVLSWSEVQSDGLCYTGLQGDERTTLRTG